MKLMDLAAFVLLLGIVILGRVVPHPPNFSPMASAALLASVLWPRYRAGVWLCLLGLGITDFAVLGFYSSMLWVYLAFILVGFWGSAFGKPRPFAWGVGVLGSGLIFYLISNFGVWFSGEALLYPKTIKGLFDCYVAAIPFYRNSLLGDLYFGSLFYAIYKMFESRVSYFQKSVTNV